jgi:hypothetical protein
VLMQLTLHRRVKEPLRLDPASNNPFVLRVT